MIFQHAVFIKPNVDYVRAPHYIPQIDWVKCSYRTITGRIEVEWHREKERIRLTVKKDSSVVLIYDGKELGEESVIVL